MVGVESGVQVGVCWSTKGAGVVEMDEPDELDRLAEKLFQGVLTPEAMPDVIASLAAWMQPATSAGSAGSADFSNTPSCCPHSHEIGINGHAWVCRMSRKTRDVPGHAPELAEKSCAVCSLLESNRPNWQRIIDLFVHCRALREFADHAASWAHTSHVAAIILTQGGRVLDCDYRGASFLKAGKVLRMQGVQLGCADPSFQSAFNHALKETAISGRTTNLLLYAPDEADKRFSLSLTRMQRRPPSANGETSGKFQDILCLVAPLDGRRIATAQQLMDFFGLSRAEARLARAICHGDSVEEYAHDQDLRLPTVRTQLSSIFNKTGTDRQATLVRLIAGIPVVRDGGGSEGFRGTPADR